MVLRAGDHSDGNDTTSQFNAFSRTSIVAEFYRSSSADRRGSDM